MSKVEISNGKILKDRIVVPLEIGNPEQIRALKKKMGKSFYKINDFKNEVEVFEGELDFHVTEETKYYTEASFKCPNCCEVNKYNCDLDEDYETLLKKILWKA